MSSLSRYLLSAAAGTSVFSVLGALHLLLPGPSTASHDVRRFQLLFGSLAAFSSAVTVHLAVAAFAPPGSTFTSSSDDPLEVSDGKEGDSENKKNDKDAANTEDTEKRWTKKEEIWSEESEDWIERKPRDDVDQDENDKEKRNLFIVKHRVMPRQPNSEGFTVVEFKNSEHIVDTLRHIIKDAEDLYEDQAKVDVKELFLATPQITEAIAKLREELERRKDEAGAEEVNTENDAGKNVSGDAKDDKPEKVKPTSESDLAGDSVPEPELEKPQGTLAESEEQEDDEDDKHRPLAYKVLLEKVDHMNVLLSFINEHFASIHAKLDRILPKGMISYKLLWCVIKPGMVVKYNHKSSGEASAFQVRRCFTRTTMAGEQFYVSGMHLEWTGDKYVRMAVAESIPQFGGLRKLSSLDCTPVTDADRAALIERGKIYAQYAGPHYMQFVGALITPGPRPGTFVKSRADGRVMIDKSGYRKMNPSMDIWEYPDYEEDDDSDYWSENEYSYDSGKRNTGIVQAELRELSDDMHYILTPPTVHGFSFVLKEWGEMLVDSFDEIKFDSNAYDHLELDQDHKTLIRALVDASRGDRKEKLISDVVDGKGGGLIAVLHGNPGVGKTLTAEAVAELLQRPLYVQGAGDLGVDAHTLETRLRDTLEIARVWRAVVLIDEADIFLEARSHHEVSRNAMVGVFLRTLEYQQGILFLTTNRVKSFDEAFLSRFSVAIRYPDLDQARRQKVWIKFLILAGCDVEGHTPALLTDGGHTNGSTTPPKAFINKKDLMRFSAVSLNGRVVKQTVRTAQALAISNDEPLNATHVDRILRINKRFQEDFESAAPDYQVAGESWQSRSSLYH